MSVNTSFGFANGLPGAITITGSSETQIVVPAFAYNSGAPVPSPAFAAGSPLQIQVPADVASGDLIDGRPFKVKVTGTFTVGTAGTDFLPTLYLGNSSTLGSNTKLVGPTAGTDFVVTAGDSYNFQLEATLLWDSTSTALNGSYSIQVGNNAVSTGSLTNAGASVAQDGLIFTLSVTFTAQTGSATFNLKQFAIEAA